MDDRLKTPAVDVSVASKSRSETTDQALFVRTSREGMETWNRRKIVDALIRETYVDPETAERISLEVEEQLVGSKTRVLTAPLVRELVDAKLIEYGLETARRMHTRLGMPLYDVEQLITSPNKENANVPHGPEATNLTLAENIKKEYALLTVFSQDVSDAHMAGDIHLHDLGFIDRPYCSGQSLEYVKKFGLNLPNSLSIAKPAKHPEVLLAHMVKFSAALQSHFAGAIGWDAVNLFFAPYLRGISEREIKQLAQILIFEYLPAGGGPGRPGHLLGHQPLLGNPEALRRRPGHRPRRCLHRPELRRLPTGGPGVRQGAVRGLPGGGRLGPPLLLPQATGPHHREVLPEPRDTRSSWSRSARWPRFGATPTSSSTAAPRPRYRSAAACHSSWRRATWPMPASPGGCVTRPCRT